MSLFFVGHPQETDLALFAGGESGPLSRWRIERHLESCPACKAAVADYFHLAAELQPLADLPEVDWDALALGVERRLAGEAAEAAAPRTGVPRLAWAAGLAAVAVFSGVIAMRQQPPAQMVSLESFAKVEAGAAARDAQPRIAAPTAVAEAREEAVRVGPRSASEEEPREPIELARAGRMVADEAAPPPPPAPAGGVAVMRSAAPPPAAPMAMDSTAVFDSAVFDIEPLQAGADDVRVAADGWVSVRWVSAEGRVTIADVYAP